VVTVAARATKSNINFFMVWMVFIVCQMISIGGLP
jgi:uncharacterized MAPEG superfamily protein